MTPSAAAERLPIAEGVSPAEGTETPIDESKLMHHSYDGIREYDNPLPAWWRMIFVGSIVFAVFYGLYFHVVHWGKTPQETYRAELAEYQSNKSARDAADAKNVSEEVLAANAKNVAIVQHGAEVFATRCVSCHTADGRGLIGPNLTDLFQLHGTTRMDLYKTVRGGVPGTAMLAWGEQMPAADVLAVASFVTTLRGQNVAGGKPPQGQPVEAFR
jgi:cytochrome c oxidase cbb3-type subunit 3